MVTPNAFFYLCPHVIRKLYINQCFKIYPFELTELLAHDLQVCVVKLPIPDVLLAQTLYKGTLVDSIPLL
jgi:hypothetical protein